jgi:MFS transporter, FSR family, fosmidomycin resistance protein
MLARGRALVQPDDARRRRGVLASSGVTHFLHDGFSDGIYLLLPIWQAEFGLSLAATGVLKSCYSGALAAFQMPAGLLAERFGERALLAIGTVVTGLGFMALGLAGGFLGLALTLIVAGAGSGTQHPLNATVVAAAYPDRGRRAALGIYNFTGDLGKVAVPMAAALVIAASDWRFATAAYGAIGIVVAGLAFVAMRALAAGDSPIAEQRAATQAFRGSWGITDRRGFGALAAIGIVDSAVRTGFLTFLPFLLQGKGADVPTIGLALGLAFAGGASGKFLCGVLAERAGILRTVIVAGDRARHPPAPAGAAARGPRNPASGRRGAERHLLGALCERRRVRRRRAPLARLRPVLHAGDRLERHRAVRVRRDQ